MSPNFTLFKYAMSASWIISCLMALARDGSSMGTWLLAAVVISMIGMVVFAVVTLYEQRRPSACKKNA